jgi:hypothetical protein
MAEFKRTSDEWGPQSQCGPMKKSWFGDWRTPKGLPTASAPGNGSRSDAKGIIVGVHDRQP